MVERAPLPVDGAEGTAAVMVDRFNRHYAEMVNEDAVRQRRSTRSSRGSREVAQQARAVAYGTIRSGSAAPGGQSREGVNEVARTAPSSSLRAPLRRRGRLGSSVYRRRRDRLSRGALTALCRWAERGRRRLRGPRRISSAARVRWLSARANPEGAAQLDVRARITPRRRRWHRGREKPFRSRGPSTVRFIASAASVIARAMAAPAVPEPRI